MLAQNVGATKQKRKPPAGLDTHMLHNRLAAATGIGKRGAESKASDPAPVNLDHYLHLPQLAS